MKKLSQLICGLLVVVSSLAAVQNVSAREPAPTTASRIVARVHTMVGWRSGCDSAEAVRRCSESR